MWQTPAGGHPCRCAWSPIWPRGALEDKRWSKHGCSISKMAATAGLIPATSGRLVALSGEPAFSRLSGAVPTSKDTTGTCHFQTERLPAHYYHTLFSHYRINNSFNKKPKQRCANVCVCGGRFFLDYNFQYSLGYLETQICPPPMQRQSLRRTKEYLLR